MVMYTVGYSKMSSASHLLTLADDLDAVIIDVRARPVSRKPGFSKSNLVSLLASRYEWHGDVLGGRVKGRGPGVTKEGIDLLRSRGGENLVLMCMEHEPWLCHRRGEICAPYFPDAIHIMGDEGIVERDLAVILADLG